jgi:sigma-B regulation protein RsbU (phosphoserine phosphatase)
MMERYFDRPSRAYSGLSIPPLRTRRSGIRDFRRKVSQYRPVTTDCQVRYRLDQLTATEHSSLEQDLERAAEVQRQLLPAEHIRLQGWEISYHYQALGAVGGDYCDVITHGASERELLLAFGDASGKGIAASLMMAQLHTIFQCLGSARLPIQELIERANRILCKQAVCSSYATLVCVRATSEGDIELCNAGHCSPLFVGQDGIAPIESGGFPLGMFPEAPCSVITKRLAKGESLFLYTDGLTEARDRCDREYGTERLLRKLSEASTLPPQELIEACLQSVAAFQAGIPPSDDVTVMAMRYV